MKKYYAVCTSCYDEGMTIASLVDVIEAEEKPENIYKERSRCDVYVDWFDSYDEAMEFVEENKLA